MAIPIVTSLLLGKKDIKDFSNLVIQQSLFGHHHLSVEIPFDALEGSEKGFLTVHEELMGKPIAVELSPRPGDKPGEGAAEAGTLKFKGLVTHLEVGNQGDLTGSFTIQGASPTYVLAGVPRYRTFRQQTLTDIFRTVLKDASDQLAPQLKQTSARLRYVVQYGESDFVFLHRLAAQYGEWLYYDGTALCLGRPTGDALPFQADGVRSGCRLRFGLQPANAAVVQYQTARNEVMRADSSSQPVPWVSSDPYTDSVANASAALFPNAGVQAPGRMLDDQTELTLYATQLKSQQTAQLITCKGWGENPAMGLGRVLAVSGKGLGTQAVSQESFGNYLLTTVTHIVDADNYHNVFEAVPAKAEHPVLNPHVQAPVGHPELAEVIDLRDPERLGRLRLRYQWPVAKPAEAETDWVRATTPYSGDGKGQLFSPELKSQVLVGYEQNRAEQPVVLGNLVHGNNQQKAKYSSADNATKGLQTAGGNKFVMTDTKGEQKVLISNSNNKGTAVELGFKGDGSISIKSNGPVTITGSSIMLEAGDEGDISLHAKNVSIEAEENIQLTAKKTVGLDGKDLQLEVGNDLQAQVGNNMQTQVSSNLTMQAGGQAKLSSADTDVI